jgi:hypothetical protein
MVNAPSGLTFSLLKLVLAQGQPQTPLSRLDPQTRVKLLAALAGLIILGFGMVALAWLGARVTRRYMNQGDRPSRRPLDDDDWARKPLLPLDRPERRERESDS